MNNTYYFIRHGKSMGNKTNRYSGTKDDPLAKEGVEQALALRKTLAGMKFDLIYSSPLLRAFHTAMISLGIAIPIFNSDGSYTLQFSHSATIPVITDPRLCERGFGDIQGLSEEQVRNMPKYKGKEPNLSFTDKADGGENFADLKDRYLSFLHELHSRFSGLEILTFTHNGPMRLTRGYFEGLSEEDTLKASTTNCGLIKYQK